MLFNSYLFIFVFLPLCLSGFWLLRIKQGANSAIIWLITASLLFYMWWKPSDLILLCGSILANYALCRTIAFHPDYSRWILRLGISANLALLAYFKYASFLIENALAPIGLAVSGISASTLPLAISFYTFQQVAFLVDVSRGTLKPPSFRDYAASVTFFPHLIAGPIVQYREMMPQFQTMLHAMPSRSAMAAGVALFSVGLFKKQVVADPCGQIANRLFDAELTAIPSLVETWIGVFAYTAQIYFDFSAYSDMAIGLAYLFGIVLPKNFDSPYRAVSIIQFWRCWHITLSEFLRNYLYIPLGGGRKGSLQKYSNILLTMLIGGLWHGAGWTFLCWGALHGIFVCINHLWRSANLHMPKSLAWTLTFLSVSLAWVFFRAESLHDVNLIYQGLLNLNSLAQPSKLMTQDAILVVLALTVTWVFPNAVNIVRAGLQGDATFRWSVWKGVLVAVLLVIGLLNLTVTSEFLYFNF